MFIKSLELQNYRNYNTLSMEFDYNTNIIYGDNAQGKTNILEAIFMGSTTKSHKGSRDRDIIKLDQEESHIKLYVEKENIEHKIDMHLKKSKSKGVAIDGIPIKKSSELYGLIQLVFFSPEDLSIIKNGPSERRRFLDLQLCQLDKIYLNHLSNYNKVLNQRNKLLKQLSFNKELLDTLLVWDKQLVKYGNYLIRHRMEYVQQLKDIIYNIHKRLSGNQEELVVYYEPNASIDTFEYRLKENLERDIVYKTTSVGPHRDDISFLNNAMDIRKFGSQGQQRTSALSLKLAEIELVKRTTQNKPILLLDDVLSELDRKRQNYLLDSINNIQTIITCTGLEEFINNRFHINTVYKVTEGNIKREN